MNDVDSVLVGVCELVSELTGWPIDSLSGSVPLLGGDLDLDSVAIATLLDMVESRYSVNIAEADLNLSSLQSLATLSRMVAGLIES